MSEASTPIAASETKPPSPGFVLPQRAFWQLLVAVFVVPQFGNLLRFLNFNISASAWIDFNFLAWASEQIGVYLQVALVCDALGRVANTVWLRWGLLLASFVYLSLGNVSGDEPLSIWLSIGSVIAFWMIWDPSPFAWRAQGATLIGFWMIAVWYSDVGRNATALTNLSMSLHIVTVSLVMLALYAAGWRLRLPDSAAPVEPAKFSFAQMLVWVTCCGLGLAMLRFVDFGAEHTFVTNFGESNRRLAAQFLIFVVVMPLVNLLAMALMLHRKLRRVWLVVITAVTIVALVTLWFGVFPVLLVNPFRVGRPWYSELVEQIKEFLPFAYIPTALITVYSSAGYRWSRK